MAGFGSWIRGFPEALKSGGLSGLSDPALLRLQETMSRDDMQAMHRFDQELGGS